MTGTLSATTVHRLHSFDDPAVEGVWSAALARHDGASVFQTPAWHRAWWETFHPGELLLLTAQRGGRAVALAPLYVDGGMGFLVGSGGSDYLDLLGFRDEPDALAETLSVARDCIPDFVGFRFYHVPDSSTTGSLLAQVAPRLGLRCFEEGSLVAPRLRLEGQDVAGVAGKTSLLRHQRWFERNGDLQVSHLTAGADVEAELPAFFDQHIRRWQGTPFPSLFEQPQQRSFYSAITRHGSTAGWLRMTRVSWDGAPVAYHLGFSAFGSYLWYKPSFEIELARRSPGEVLLRHLLLAAAAEGAAVFDLGLGEEPFKSRFADGRLQVRTWGLYPEGAA